MSTKNHDARVVGFANLARLTIGGGLVFWATTIVISVLPIAAEYRNAFSKASVQSVRVGSLFSGMIVACCISYSLLRFFDRIPTKNSIPKSVLLSLITMVIATILVVLPRSFLGSSDVFYYFLVGIMLDLPRFLLLGIAIGFLYQRLFQAD